MSNTKRKTRPDDSSEAHFFGFRRVKRAEKTGLVQEVFAAVAGRYDLMNDLMSGGLHRLWKDRLVGMMGPRAGQTILDIAGGTGDIALRCYKRVQPRLRPSSAKRVTGVQSSRTQVIVCDLNPAMLEEGRAKVIDHGVLKNSIKWVTGNAEELPLPSRSVDLACIGFGLRNVTHIDQALCEAARVLKPGGRFYCLEFSPGVTPALKPIYDRYCMQALPHLGAFVAGNREAYQYLAESIRQFPLQPVLAKRMEKAGFSGVKWVNLTGGIAVIHWGWKS